MISLFLKYVIKLLVNYLTVNFCFGHEFHIKKSWLWAIFIFYAFVSILQDCAFKESVQFIQVFKFIGIKLFQCSLLSVYRSVQM